MLRLSNCQRAGSERLEQGRRGPAVHFIDANAARAVRNEHMKEQMKKKWSKTQGSGASRNRSM